MPEKKHTMSDLHQMQGLPLNAKIRMTEYRIREWINAFGTDGVYVSFSGGKDSTVLLDIICNRMGYKSVPAVFVDVPTQYPELKSFAKEFCEKNGINLEILKPKMSFMEVCEKYGFPLISKEVSESVYGARKYLKDVLDELNERNQNPDRQTDRQTDRQPRYRYFYEKVTGTGKYSKFLETLSTVDSTAIAKNSGGGYDRKYRRLRGIGEFSKQQNGQQNGRSKSTVGEYVGMENKGQQQTCDGEPP